MKKAILLVLLSLAAHLGAVAQFGLGMRDTRYLNVNYTIAERFNVELEHSIFAEKFKYQHVRLSASYTLPIKHFELAVKPYFGTLYSGDYCDVGALLSVRYRPVRPLTLCGTFNPHYDSGLKYKTCFMLGAECVVYRALSVVAHYTTIPEYRESERRVRAGLRLDVNSLWVQPLLSIPVKSGETKSLRVAVSMGYRF